VAADAVRDLLAPTTIDTAFQRISVLMRRSSFRSPGYGGCSSGGMVFTYGRHRAEGHHHAVVLGVLLEPLEDLA
jgi:hypothetical protein